MNATTNVSAGISVRASVDEEAKARGDCLTYRLFFESIANYYRDDGVRKQMGTSGYVSTGYMIVVLYVVVITFGASGNLLSCLSVLRNPQMRTNHNLFIFNLALSDFMLCTVNSPITLYTILKTFWPFGEIACKFVGSLQGFNIFTSALSISAIGFDRYVVVIFPTKRVQQRRLWAAICLLVWSVSLAMVLPYFVATGTNVVYDARQTSPRHNFTCDLTVRLCMERNDSWASMPITREQYTVMNLLVVYLLPLFSLIFVYSSIASRMRNRLVVRRSQQPGGGTQQCQEQSDRMRSAEGRQRRTTVLLWSIVVVFATSWAPLYIFHMLNSFGVISFNVTVFAICHVLGMTSACANPVLYGVLNDNFRVEYVYILEQVGVFPLLRMVKSRLVPVGCSCDDAKDSSRHLFVCCCCGFLHQPHSSKDVVDTNSKLLAVPDVNRGCNGDLGAEGCRLLPSAAVTQGGGSSGVYRSVECVTEATHVGGEWTNLQAINEEAEAESETPSIQRRSTDDVIQFERKSDRDIQTLTIDNHGTQSSNEKSTAAKSPIGSGAASGDLSRLNTNTNTTAANSPAVENSASVEPESHSPTDKPAVTTTVITNHLAADQCDDSERRHRTTDVAGATGATLAEGDANDSGSVKRRKMSDLVIVVNTV